MPRRKRQCESVNCWQANVSHTAIPFYKPLYDIIFVKDHWRLPRKAVNHSVHIYRKCYSTHCSQPIHCCLFAPSAYIPVPAKPHNKQYPQWRCGIEIQPPFKTTGKNEKDCSCHSTACTWKSCKNKLRTKGMKYLSGHHIISCQQEDWDSKILDILPYSVKNIPHVSCYFLKHLLSPYHKHPLFLYISYLHFPTVCSVNTYPFQTSASVLCKSGGVINILIALRFAVNLI